MSFPGERRRLQEEALQLGAWQGAVETTLKQHGEHLATINGSIDRLNGAVAAVSTDVGYIKWESDRRTVGRDKRRYIGGGAALSFLVTVAAFLTERALS
jgi:hypothetical protein